MTQRFIEFSIKKKWLIIISTIIVTILTGLFIPKMKVDTDPENMLSVSEPVRVFHNRVKKQFALWDMIVLGVVNNSEENGVFNPATLNKIYRITEGIKKIPGVITQDIISPSTVDDILQAGPGTIRFQYLMRKPITSQKEALQIRDRAFANPLLKDTLVSSDGKALAIYIPIKEKRIAHKVGSEINSLIAKEKADPESYYMTGLPIAEDTFGYEMFYQMSISAPLAGVVIFILMWIFFRNITLILAPMIIAILTVIITMGLLIACGFTIHIMSSMIPIFLMPISVVDSVHVLSMFFDWYSRHRDRVKTLRAVMSELFKPMLYTSLTTMVGFASLMMTPIPPVRVFGAFVAIGVGIAWILTVLLIPAYVMVFLPDKRIKIKKEKTNSGHAGILQKALNPIGESTIIHHKLIISISVAILALSVIGITKIEINDNPVKWFAKKHPIRIADKVLNSHFAGTYEAYLVLNVKNTKAEFGQLVKNIKNYLNNESKLTTSLNKRLLVILEELNKKYADSADTKTFIKDFYKKVSGLEDSFSDDLTDEFWDEWDRFLQFIEDQKAKVQVFKSPDVLRYVERLQKDLTSYPLVGKINTLTDIVKKVHQELFEGKKEKAIIPSSAEAVAQCLLSYQGSHDPDDLWHFVTPDYRSLNLWFQLKSGDNKDMEAVIKRVRNFFKENPPPVPMEYHWAGLTYINVIWQNKMVAGMLKSLLGSFIIVFIMMAFLFRSALWGFLSMIPLSTTICFIYGVIGWIGKDYDMPVAVLSSLTLGMSIDFAIHFIQRSTEIYSDKGSWQETNILMFQEPARAITRNAIVIAVGFLPLLFAHLIPYRTVGFLIASIMAVSAVATLIILPSMINIFEKKLFKVSPRN